MNDEMARTVPAGMLTLLDEKGRTLDEQVQETLLRVENRIREAFAFNGAAPEKPYVVTAKVEITAKGEYVRVIGTTVSLKEPELTRSFTAHGEAEDGVLMVTQSARQYRLDEDVQHIGTEDEAANG